MADKYIYTLVRRDLSLQDTVVQVGHSCLIAGAAYSACNRCFHIVVSVRSEKELIQYFNFLCGKDIKCEAFYEPNNAAGEELGWTSLTTGPLSYSDRKYFCLLPLWKPLLGIDKLFFLWSNMWYEEERKWEVRKSQLKQILRQTIGLINPKILARQVKRKRGKQNDSSSN